MGAAQAGEAAATTASSRSITMQTMSQAHSKNLAVLTTHASLTVRHTLTHRASRQRGRLRAHTATRAWMKSWRTVAKAAETLVAAMRMRAGAPMGAGRAGMPNTIQWALSRPLPRTTATCMSPLVHATVIAERDSSSMANISTSTNRLTAQMAQHLKEAIASARGVGGGLAVHGNVYPRPGPRTSRGVKMATQRQGAEGMLLQQETNLGQ